MKHYAIKNYTEEELLKPAVRTKIGLRTGVTGIIVNILLVLLILVLFHLLKRQPTK